MGYFLKSFLAIASLSTLALCQNDPNFAPERDTIVHLFEWKWKDIANECENFLSKVGYGGVQISPPNENIIIKNRPWWERYQPVSYKLITRSGDENDFKDMVKRCNQAGVRIYVDAVINHMAAGSGKGTGGSTAEVGQNVANFPAVPYQFEDFHTPCGINDYNNANEVRNCELVGLKDLDQSKESVRNKILAYMDHLIDLGVAGFRVDAVKHMTPEDVKAIFSLLKNLNTEHGFAPNSRPFIFQEVIDLGGNEGVHREEYTKMGRVLEFKYGKSLSNVFRGNDKLKWLVNWGPEWGLLPSEEAVAFIDNHDNQRTDNTILTYKLPKNYKMAVAFMLAHPYGVPRVMSSFDFTDNDQAPPHDAQENLLSPGFNDDNTCTNGWICEHRWRQIYNMVTFRNVAGSAPIQNWWSNDDQQIAFSRGNSAFVAFNQFGNLNESLQTGLPAGTYCDIISGEKVDQGCNGKSVKVDNNGQAMISIAPEEEDSMLAVHVNSKL